MMRNNSFRFGDFELDSGLCQLREKGRPVPIEPKVLDVLLYLVRERERVVPRGELLDRLWRDSVVNEEALSRAIYKAREALRDDGSEQRWIRTLRRQGFRFVGEVEAPPLLAGQEAVVRQLMESFTECRQGLAHIILLEGSAGQIAQEIVSRGRALGAQVVHVSCEAIEDTPAPPNRPSYH